MGYSVPRRRDVDHRAGLIRSAGFKEGSGAEAEFQPGMPPGAPVKSAVNLFIILMSVWLLNSGHYTSLMIGFGVGSSLLVVFLSLRMGIVDDEGVPVHLVPRALRYAPWLVKEILKSNVDVARRVLTPGRPRISPRIIEAGTTQRSDLGRVIYANSITLTPGTVSIRVHGPYITVHAIADDVAEGLLEGEMDRRVTTLEGRAS